MKQCGERTTTKVPAMYRAALEKADWLVSHADTHISAFRDVDGEVCFYVLSRNNSGKYKKITKKLLELFEKALRGEKDRRIEDYKELVQVRIDSDACMVVMVAFACAYVKYVAKVPQVCQSMHYVCKETEDTVPPCEGNPGHFSCYCKVYEAPTTTTSSSSHFSKRVARSCCTLQANAT